MRTLPDHAPERARLAPDLLDEHRFRQLSPPLPVLFFNSLLLATVVCASNVVLAALGGYAFARLRFPGREALFLIVLATLMIPDQLRMVPVYQILVALHLITPEPWNYLGVIMVQAIGS